MAVKKRKFTEEELKVMEENSDKISLRDLATLMSWDYTNLSTAMNQQKIQFVSKRAPIKRYFVEETSNMNKKRNSNNEKLITDEHLKEWFKVY